MYKNKKQEAAFRKGFQILMGNSVQKAFKPYFQTFIDRRNQITQSVHAAHAIYTLAYEDAKQKMLADLKEKGEIRYRVVSQGKNKGEIHLALAAGIARLVADRVQVVDRDTRETRASRLIFTPTVTRRGRSG